MLEKKRLIVLQSDWKCIDVFRWHERLCQKNEKIVYIYLQFSIIHSRYVQLIGIKFCTGFMRIMCATYDVCFKFLTVLVFKIYPYMALSYTPDKSFRNLVKPFSKRYEKQASDFFHINDIPSKRAVSIF